MDIALIVAMARNGTIGRNNELPWHLSGDLRYFKAVTMGKPVVMGRKTWESIGRPLPGRTNIVITRQAGWLPECDNPDTVKVAHSLEQALQLAEQVATADGVSELMVMGGAEIYRQALPLAKRLYITEVNADVEGDAFFPEMDDSQWRELQRTAGDPGGDYSYDFVVLDRNS
ncbi:dihydrofolate reductase [Porticoccus sp. W117]|uniref:dihydrofolate reductase n=1 Tax=Porticoccus sp. W117 TaxID=3054777 RepID=UPI002596A884|nr:dihydrofolate reductase [Porticoccus sp. W117]MDM3872305.1 dihydrofolate reductase [Porticoccus sp. W117]